MADIPNEQVIKYGDEIGRRGSDIVSVNTIGADVTLWDSKFRSSNRYIADSPTFKTGSNSLENAVNEAIVEIRASNLSPSVKENAIQKLLDGNFSTKTVGSGSAKNSRVTRFCSGKPC
ncbi:hypothetical protein D3C72_1891930 [compost metagenome]